MTSTESHIPGDLLKKYGAEIMPSSAYKRDERIRSLASSFEEIAESEEESEMPESSSASSGGRSPYAQTQSPLGQRRSNSLTHNALVSPKFAKKNTPPRLVRGFSDPMMRRKGSLGSLLNAMASERLSIDSGCDILSLPTIPETAASPIQPEESEEYKKHQYNKENA